MAKTDNSATYLRLLSRALLGSNGGLRQSDSACHPPRALGTASVEDLGDIWTLANSHHVIMRAFPALQELLTDDVRRGAGWIDRAMERERARVQHALSYLSPICKELEDAGEVVVIKSLDHWPDLGSDLDLYTNAQAADVVGLMRTRFEAHPAERSWGDRLANKWNFVVPGLPELVEVHVARLGQTGEQTAITESLIARSSVEQFGDHTLRVPAPEDRMVISTLQRMYRHFYIRLCDIVDNARLVDSGVVDYGLLKSLAVPAGLWDGLATYLVIASGYVEQYRGEPLPLPPLVTNAARFGNELIDFRRNFLRVPLFPQAAALYVSEWKRLLLNGEIRSTLRLSLLPGLATAAALELKLTGSDKGIW